LAHVTVTVTLTRASIRAKFSFDHLTVDARRYGDFSHFYNLTSGIEFFSQPRIHPDGVSDNSNNNNNNNNDNKTNAINVT
jgi:hypothetical protein